MRGFRHDFAGLLFLLPKKRIEKLRGTDVVAEFAMLEKDVHRLPERVIENLDQFLMHEGVGGRGADGVRAGQAG